MLQLNVNEASRKIWNWTVSSKHVIIECERSKPENLSNRTVASEASGKFLENVALFPIEWFAGINCIILWSQI